MPARHNACVYVNRCFVRVAMKRISLWEEKYVPCYEDVQNTTVTLKPVPLIATTG